ncbi:MAG: Thioredoxin [Lentisphaerae bacterium ADurb.Bin082]|nr:MAG: Thioredoxin [Lentisphaerae bacterium ADurb.Bin082]
MGSCTVCPFVKYWYLVVAVFVVVWLWSRMFNTPKQAVQPEITGVENLTEDSFTAAIASGPVLVDFWAGWCGPCRRQMPIIAETVADLPEGVRIAKVNVDEQKALAKRYQISGIPAWVLFKDGKEVKRVSGVQSKENLLALAASMKDAAPAKR